jgi:MYXO-CTERM domain-containing protein
LAAIRRVNRLPPDPVRSARIVSYRSQEVKVDAIVERPALLVLNDSDYPGWKVYVDGRRSHWITANYLFRGVLLRPGRHLVRFAYEPGSLAAGGAISGVGLLGLAGYVVGRRRRTGLGITEAQLV